jgi:hypothetical protein
MEEVAGIVIFAVVLSAFYTNTSLLFYGLIVVTIATLGLHGFDCLKILADATGTCQPYADVIEDLQMNLAAVSGAFVLSHTGLAIIRSFTRRI